MNCYELIRDEDVSGISGTGKVGEVVEFLSGKVAVSWCTPLGVSNVIVYDSLADVHKIHGHGGKTRIVPCETARGPR